MKTRGFGRIICGLALSAVAVAPFGAANATWIEVLADTTYGEGTVTPNGGKEYKVGTKVNLKATAKKGSGFVSWQKGSTVISFSPSYAYTVDNVDATFTAYFVSARSDTLGIIDKSSNGTCSLATGVTPDLTFGILSLSATTITVSGLPSGVKYVKGTGTDKLGHFEGAPKKPGVYWVAVKAQNANGYQSVCVQKWIVGGASDTSDTNPLGVNWEDGNVNQLFGSSSAVSTGKVIDNVRLWFVLSGKNVTKLSVSGLPPGLKFVNDGTWDIVGYPTKAGKYAVKFSATANGKAVSFTRTIRVNSDSRYVDVVVPDAYLGYGTVSGSGVYVYGSKVKLTAKPSFKHTVFAGWYADSACSITKFKDWLESGDWRKASDTLLLTTDCPDNIVYAKFVDKSDDFVLLHSGPTDTGRWDLEVGVDEICDYDIESRSYPTLTAKGLPAGVTIDAKKGEFRAVTSKMKPGMVYETVFTAKNVSGLTDVRPVDIRVAHEKFYGMPNLKHGLDGDADCNYLIAGEDVEESGIDASLSKTAILDGCVVTAVSGLPPGVKYDKNANGGKGGLVGVPTKAGVYRVEFKVKLGNDVYLATITINVSKPYFAGTSAGYTAWDADGKDVRPDSRPVTISITDAGKVTAKIGTLSFSGTGWKKAGDNLWSVTLETSKSKSGGVTTYHSLTLTASSVPQLFGSTYKPAISGTFQKVMTTYSSGTAVTPPPDQYVFAHVNSFGNGSMVDDMLARIVQGKSSMTYYYDVSGAGKYTLEMGSWFFLGYDQYFDKKLPLKVTFDKKGNMKVAGKIYGHNVSGTTPLHYAYDSDGGYHVLRGTLLLTPTNGIHILVEIDLDFKEWYYGLGVEPQWSVIDLDGMGYVKSDAE